MASRQTRILLGSLILLAALTLTLPAVTTATDGTPRPDPANDTIGWEDGYWYDDSININSNDGLSEAELDRYTARAMARVEQLRNLEFTDDVPVEVVSRSDYQSTQSTNSANASFTAWNNQVWEALFITGESTNIQQSMQDLRGSQVQGYYTYQSEKIVIVSPDSDETYLSESTLVHELTHALQDQHYDMQAKKFSGDVQDTQLATRGLIEGDAKYVEKQFTTKCNTNRWNCVQTRQSPGGSSMDVNLGLHVLLYHPYADGAAYVHQLHQTGGWDAVNAAYRNPPNSTREIISPGTSSATRVSLEDTSFGGWERFPDQLGRDGTDSVGEASVYTMFWYQTYKYGTAVIASDSLSNTSSPYDTYNYRSPPSHGLLGDTLAPYRNGNQSGYVWKTVWETKTDAGEFKSAYTTVLNGHDAKKVTANTWVIQEGPYADAFVVKQVNETVYIANGPTRSVATQLMPSAASTPNKSECPETGENCSTTTARKATTPNASSTPAQMPSERITPSTIALAAFVLLCLVALGRFHLQD